MNTRNVLGRRSLAALAAGGILMLGTALPATAGQAPAVMLPDPVGNGSGSSVPGPVVQKVDDDALELIQIGLGALGGIALAGTGAAVVRTRRHHHPQLA